MYCQTCLLNNLAVWGTARRRIVGAVLEFIDILRFCSVLSSGVGEEDFSMYGASYLTFDPVFLERDSVKGTCLSPRSVIQHMCRSRSFLADHVSYHPSDSSAEGIYSEKSRNIDASGLYIRSPRSHKRTTHAGYIVVPQAPNWHRPDSFGGQRKHHCACPGLVKKRQLACPRRSSSSRCCTPTTLLV